MVINRGAHRDDYGHEVFVRRQRECDVRRGLAVAEETVDIATFDHILRPEVEFVGPAGRLRIRAALHHPQVVDEEATADDSDAFVAERRKLASEVEQRWGVHRGKRDLQDRDIGVRVHGDHGDVRAVIEAAIGLFLHRL